MYYLVILKYSSYNNGKINGSSFLLSNNLPEWWVGNLETSKDNKWMTNKVFFPPYNYELMKFLF